MTLRGRRVNRFLKLWCLVASGGLGIWASSTSFQKSSIGWPQQHLTEKVLNFNVTFHDPTKKLFFSKHQNKAEFKNLDDSEVFSSDFSSLRNLCSHIDLIGLCNLSGLNSLYSPISSKNFLILMVRSSLAPKSPIWIPFCGMDHEKSTFYWYLRPCLSEAVEASLCYFFENWLKKLKCPNLLNTPGTMIQDNYQSFYLSEPFTLACFNMRHPVG